MADLATTPSYPIALKAGPQETSSRFFAILAIGYIVKAIILIPHALILYVLYIVMSLGQLVIWAPVLFGGRYPDWAYALNAGSIRWYTRYTWYFFGLSDKYPEFSMDAPDDLFIEQPATSNRWWALPLVGFVGKSIILIPHFFIWYVLALVTGLAHLVIWIPVLFTGQYPSWGYSLTSGFILWSARLFGYFLGLTDRYPPFSMT